MAQENLKSYMADISHSVTSLMAGNSHTLTCCVSKPRSILEAGKKQLSVWLGYACNMAEVLLYSSFGVPKVFLWFPFDGSKMILSRLKDDFGWQTPTNIGYMVKEDCFVFFHPHIHHP